MDGATECPWPARTLEEPKTHLSPQPPRPPQLTTAILTSILFEIRAAGPSSHSTSKQQCISCYHPDAKGCNPFYRRAWPARSRTSGLQPTKKPRSPTKGLRLRTHEPSKPLLKVRPGKNARGPGPVGCSPVQHYLGKHLHENVALPTARLLFNEGTE